VDAHSTHVTRTTLHRVPHSEQMQNRVLCALGQPTTALAISGLPHTGHAPSATSFRSSATSCAARREKCT
jgi:hypothetical protein